ncbi:hypothetical protein [Methylobacterium brachythecii]|uniref:Uncharacterized protein n=1 Tax=Methylobacterium brachythecii TaxID=1176177 RepID=A0A7W6ALY6_9HYPH|nr:hypothetical protein [Methylobacterium brachythecii]MBB3905068.1 hypothetical protein [Methylobacterium brachythecii]GLS44424.1 hypothetical protein GCM10007884_24120 [Methylobacterium brachythecii]
MKTPKPLPPPTDDERRIAGEAARDLRAAIADPSTMGVKGVMHVDYSRPRRSEWLTTWSNLPGFFRSGRHYTHACLPGWVYARHEIKAEMIPDLEALAERGVRPIEATGAAA